MINAIILCSVSLRDWQHLRRCGAIQRRALTNSISAVLAATAIALIGTVRAGW